MKSKKQSLNLAGTIQSEVLIALRRVRLATPQVIQIRLHRAGKAVTIFDLDVALLRLQERGLIVDVPFTSEDCKKAFAARATGTKMPETHVSLTEAGQVMAAACELGALHPTKTANALLNKIYKNLCRITELNESIH